MEINQMKHVKNDENGKPIFEMHGTPFYFVEMTDEGEMLMQNRDELQPAQLVVGPKITTYSEGWLRN